MLGIFSGSKIVIYVFIAITLIGSGCGIYYAWKRDIERQALMDFNQKQMEQSLKDQQDFLEKQEKISKVQQEAARDLLEENQKISRKLESVSTYLGSTDAKRNDRPASDILKNTVEGLAKSLEKNK
jgi:hypothetical protein